MYKFVWEFSSKSNTKLFHKLKKKNLLSILGGSRFLNKFQWNWKFPSSVYSSTLLILSGN